MPEIAISIELNSWALPISVGWSKGMFSRTLDISVLCVHIELWVMK